jgi:hypothetical protein
MGLGSVFRIRPRDEEGLLKRQKLNGFTLLILTVLGLGSLTYGYTASIIGTTLGMKYSSSTYPTHISDLFRPTFLYRVLRARYAP